MKTTYDKHGQILTYDSGDMLADVRVPNQNGTFITKSVPVKFWLKCTRDNEGRELSFHDSTGFYSRTTRNPQGEVVHYADSNGYEFTQKFNEEGKLVQFTDSAGVGVDYSTGEDRTVTRVTHSDGHGYEWVKTPDGETKCTKF